MLTPCVSPQVADQAVSVAGRRANIEEAVDTRFTRVSQDGRLGSGQVDAVLTCPGHWIGVFMSVWISPIDSARL